MPRLSGNVRGEGRPLVLLHGFPFNHAIWNRLTEHLARDFRVYTPDLPGFGESAALDRPFTIDAVGNVMMDWLVENEIRTPVVLGHSMGGYVALGMAAANPGMLGAIGLFHSSAGADAPEKKASRDKTIEFVQANGAQAFTSNFIQPLFANPTDPAVAEARAIAIQSTSDAVIGYTAAMRDRPDRKKILADFDKPVLFLAGAKDQVILESVMREQSAMAQFPHLHVLSDAGHMGMYEQPIAAAEVIKRFASS